MSEPIPLSYLPGVCKVNSPYSDSIQQGYANGRTSAGRFTDMNNARFVAGMPEKIGGNVLAYSTALTGVPRGMKDWRDNSQLVHLGAGTSQKLYQMQNGVEFDITPYRAIKTGTLTNALTTTASSNVVTVAHTAHGLSVGDYFQMTASTIDTIPIAGTYFVATVPNANSYTFIANGTGASGVSGGGGTINYTYYQVTLTNPITTVNGSPIVTIAHTANGAINGDFVQIHAASAINGITLAGEYQIIAASANSYTINAGTNATGSGSGGGATTVQYDISIGGTDSVFGFGFGAGPYSGSQGYGLASTAGILQSARTWSMQNYGQQLLCNPVGGYIYIWDPVIAGRAYPLYGSPTCLAVIVTQERFVIALGINGNPMQIAWPDQNDYTNWISTATNTANSGRTLQGGDFMVGGIALQNGLNLLLSNTSCFTCNYSGDNYVYQTLLAGTQCGLAGPLGICQVGGIAYWWGTAEFWNYNGSVAALPSDDIRDYVFKNINLTQSAKFVCGSVVGKKEVAYYYVSAAATEIDSCVVYHIDQGIWSIGRPARTSWVDAQLFQTPMAADVNGYIYSHETGVDNNGAALDSYIVFSPMDISKGATNMDVATFIPDFQRLSGDITLTMLSQTYPQNTATANGPYDIAPGDSGARIDVRVGDKMIGYKLESNVIGGDWRLGLPRVEVQQAGARR